MAPEPQTGAALKSAPREPPFRPDPAKEISESYLVLTVAMNEAETTQAPPSSAQLSLDISRLVSRAVSGQPVDSALEGAALAQLYPELGMSGAMIGSAIERAVGMVGAIRNIAEPLPPLADEAGDSGPAVDEEPSSADRTPLIEADLASALLPSDAPILLNPIAAAVAVANGTADERASGSTSDRPAGITRQPRIAAVRRALFRG